MKQSRLVFALAAACLLVGGSGAPHAEAEGKTVIRYGTLAPAGSAFGKVLKAWSRSLSKETEGRVELRVYSGGTQGDERDVLRKIRAGQMDAAGVTTVGLSLVVRPVLVLSAPGVIETYEQLARVREKLDARFDAMFEEAGFVLMAWSDAGKGRLMSTLPIAKPADLRAARPWAWKDDPIFAEFLKVVGANPVRLGVPEVYPALQTGMVDVVPASAIGAVALQWFTKLKYMSKDSFGIVLGATLIKKEKLEELSPGDQKVLLDTAKRAGLALDQVVRRDDARAYDVMIERGIEVVDTTPFQSEWEAAGKETRERLVGRIYSKSLLEEVQAAAGSK
ncbi:MAG TPA: TRAP transporter substrate-binding protein DctP [Polyangiales bacterium]|nr:TRAP transporter substrate-binding protein DctP [Polyangiales bacterium]